MFRFCFLWVTFCQKLKNQNSLSLCSSSLLSACWTTRWTPSPQSSSEPLPTKSSVLCSSSGWAVASLPVYPAAVASLPVYPEFNQMTSFWSAVDSWRAAAGDWSLQWRVYSLERTHLQLWDHPTGNHPSAHLSVCLAVCLAVCGKTVPAYERVRSSIIRSSSDRSLHALLNTHIYSAALLKFGERQ